MDAESMIVVAMVGATGAGVVAVSLVTGGRALSGRRLARSLQAEGRGRAGAPAPRPARSAGRAAPPGAGACRPVGLPAAGRPAEPSGRSAARPARRAPRVPVG